jgi:ATP-binding cassette subfamily F protein uup
VTSTIAFEGEGRWREYEGGVQDWLTQSKRAREIAAARGRGAAGGRTGAETGSPRPRRARARSKRKLGYKEQRELEALPALIEALEQEQERIQALLALDGAIYATILPCASWPQRQPRSTTSC